MTIHKNYRKQEEKEFVTSIEEQKQELIKEITIVQNRISSLLLECTKLKKYLKTKNLKELC